MTDEKKPKVPAAAATEPAAEDTAKPEEVATEDLPTAPETEKKVKEKKEKNKGKKGKKGKKDKKGKKNNRSKQGK